MGTSASVLTRTRPATRPPGPACAPWATTGPDANSVSARTELSRGLAGTQGALLWETQPLTPLQGAPTGASGPAVSTCADVSMAAPATRPRAPAAAPRGSWGLTAASVSGRGKAGVLLCFGGRGPPSLQGGQRPAHLPAWPPLGPRLGELGCPCRLCAVPSRHAHQGGAQRPVGILPRTGPSPQSRGDFPPVWDLSGVPAGLGGGSESLSLQSRLGPAAPSGLGGAQAGWGAEEQGAGSLHSVWSTRGWRLRPAPLFPHRGEGVSQGPPPLPPAACPRGRFGAGCAHVCRCGPGATCDPVTGTCTCPPGRTGAHCELGECPRPHSHGRSRGPRRVHTCGLCRPRPGPEGQWAAQRHPRPSLP